MMMMIGLKGGKRKWFSLQLRLMRSSLRLTLRLPNINFVIDINFVTDINILEINISIISMDFINIIIITIQIRMNINFLAQISS